MVLVLVFVFWRLAVDGSDSIMITLAWAVTRVP